MTVYLACLVHGKFHIKMRNRDHNFGHVSLVYRKRQHLRYLCRIKLGCGFKHKLIFRFLYDTIFFVDF